MREELSGSEFTVSFEHEVGQFLSEGEAEGAISNVVAKMEQQCEGNEDETGVVLLITHQVETLMGLANANTNLRVAWLGSESGTQRYEEKSVTPSRRRNSSSVIW